MATRVKLYHIVDGNAVRVLQPVPCVYFLRARNGFTKIGEMVDLARRLAEHRRQWTGDFDFVLFFFNGSPAHREIEQQLHRIFAFKPWQQPGMKRKRLQGDWFLLGGADLVVHPVNKP